MLRLHSLLGDHMVLQQGENTCISGWAAPGENIRVVFKGISKKAVADEAGHWRVRLDCIDYGGPFRVEVFGHSESICLRDIFVGEVWLCSGQSNMDQRVAKGAFYWCGVDNEQEEIAAAQYPHIRLYSVRLQLSKTPCELLADERNQFFDKNAPPYLGKWTICSPETVGCFSAEAYFFARDLQRNLKVPVGIITSCYGASTAQAWIAGERLVSHPELRLMLDDFEASIQDYESGESHRKYRAKLAEWSAAERERQKTGVNLPRHLRRRPSSPKDPRLDQHSPTLLYNGMIAPLYPYAIAGIIWHHGESNQPTANKYLTLLQVLIDSWRTLLAPGFPFLIVQMPNVNEPQKQPVERARIPYIREAQFKSLAVHNVGLVVTIDIGSTHAHSRNKQEVGRRLALGARALCYKQEIGYSGPVFERAEIYDDCARLHFLHNEGMRFSSIQRAFAVASESGEFEWAEARIEMDSVIVTNPSGKKITAVRYGWAENPQVILYNRYGLPASPFRTDTT